ncbi:hypothetical protein, partial [Streptomyces sioyaensis]|uniref:hypothetical protein n=1 Tax=Streptomyces sioyaensis TaxID=67364 RepID=UPI001C2BD302
QQTGRRRELGQYLITKIGVEGVGAEGVAAELLSVERLLGSLCGFMARRSRGRPPRRDPCG